MFISFSSVYHKGPFKDGRSRSEIQAAESEAHLLEFDHEASRSAAEFEQMNPMSVIDEFSSPMPFTPIKVSIDFENFSFGMNGQELIFNSTLGGPIKYINYLIVEDGSIYTGMIGRKGRAILMPWFYQPKIIKEKSSPFLIDLIKNCYKGGGSRQDEMEAGIYFIGRLGSLCDDAADWALSAGNCYSINLTPVAQLSIRDVASGARALGNLMQETSGHLRYLMSCLAMVNKQKTVSVLELPACRVREGAKWHAKPARKSVKINVDNEREDLRDCSEKSLRKSPTPHFVRGHWVRWTIDDDCIHKWEDIPGKKVRQICKICGSRRTWRKDFRKGSEEPNKRKYEVFSTQGDNPGLGARRA